MGLSMTWTATVSGNRINVYLDDKYYRIWMSIPKMKRSKFIREALKEYGNKEG